MGKLLTLDEAAERLNTGHRFVRRLVAEQPIPYHKLGKHVRIDEDDLADYIASGRIEARPLAEAS
jgi:excisionase family DNA binding protein